MTLFDAVIYNDIKGVREALKNGVDVNAENTWGDTALTLAAWNGRTEITRLLIDEGADVNAENSEGDTALHLAAMNRRTDMVKMFLADGADPTIKNKDGQPASYWGYLLSARPEMLEILKEAEKKFEKGVKE